VYAGQAPRISRKSAHEGGKVVRPRHLPFFNPLPGDAVGTLFYYRLSRTQRHIAFGWIKSMNNPNDPTGNQTRDLSACSAASHPTGPPLTHQKKVPFFIAPNLSLRLTIFLHSCQSPASLNYCYLFYFTVIIYFKKNFGRFEVLIWPSTHNLRTSATGFPTKIFKYT
jgi:hypothetical protein